jgi:DEAD/DEAH box helicase domain-containing protein
MSEVLKSFIENRFKDEIRSKKEHGSISANFSGFPQNLNEKLKNTLVDQSIESLYSHQCAAFESISDKRDTVLVSKTASGKTLSFLLPVLNDYLESPKPFSCFLLYPTKALSRDQEGTLGKLLSLVKGTKKLGTFDGDTPREERARISKTADFVISNPDMLHSGILPNHNRKWKSFLARLKYIIIDEVHSYRGSFGSHVSNVFRRLLRVCAIHGSYPTIICSSATIGNAKEHVEALFHRSFNIIDKDGSARPMRNHYFINPKVSMSHGNTLYRKGPASVSIPIMREAAKLGIRTICFCRGRQEVERLYKSVTDKHPELRSVIKPYRGGLLPNERRQLERDLFDGKIKVIISTNALELGIDIGDLDCCILSGHPGSIASFWQQAGRVGRKGSESMVVYIAKDTPVDQYLVHHPEFIETTPVEQAWLSADNPYILLQHMPCAAHEHPLRDNEISFEKASYNQGLQTLLEDKSLAPYNDMYRYTLSDYPARGVNLRGMTDYNIEIVCNGIVIGELDPIGARGTLYKDAIYQHLGKRYMSMDLDLEKKICTVEEVSVEYYTEAVWENRVELTEEDEARKIAQHQLQFGYIHVNKQPKLYKKIKERSYENIGYGPITLPPFEYDTSGFCLLPDKQWQNAMDAIDKRYIGAAVYGLSYMIKKVAPSICMGDSSDIETDVCLTEYKGEEWKSALYVYDSVEGGVGYGEKVYERLEKVLEICGQIISECECKAGCPSCVTAVPPGIDNEELLDFMIESNASVECTKSLIRHILNGEIYEPNLIEVKESLENKIEPPEEDEEQKKLKRRMNKAAQILKNKRERLH